MLIDSVFPADIPEVDVCIAAGDIVEGDNVDAVQWLADTIGMSRTRQLVAQLSCSRGQLLEF